MDLNQLTLADFSDSHRLRSILLRLLNQNPSRISTKTELFLMLAIPLLNISLLGRLLHNEKKLQEFLHVVLEFYNSPCDVSECVMFMLKVLEFDIGSSGDWSSLLGTPWFSSNISIAIESITMMVLNVKTLSVEIKDIIQNVQKNLEKIYIQGTEMLVPSLEKYFTWVHTHTEDLRKSCQATEIVESLDKNVRAWIKGEIYENRTQIISIYHLKYKSYLQSISLPCLSYVYHDVNQALKDIAREKISINTHGLDYNDFEATINSHLWDCYSSSMPSSTRSPPTGLNTSHSRISSQGLELESDGEEDELDISPATQEVSMMQTECSHINFQVLVDFVYSHVLMASSRTIISGDIYHILGELYGGESLVISSTHVHEQVIRIHTTFDAITVEMSQVFNLCQSKAIEYPIVSFHTKSISTIRLSRLLGIMNKFATDLDDGDELLVDTLDNQYLLEDIIQQENRICCRKVSITPFLPNSK